MLPFCLASPFFGSCHRQIHIYKMAATMGHFGNIPVYAYINTTKFENTPKAINL